jgi:hypothetical protein
MSAYIYLPIVKSYEKSDYNAGRQNWDIGIDSHGVVYFGNTDGLLRNIYGLWELTPTSNNDVVRSLCVDNDTIWTGGDVEFGYFVKTGPENLSYVKIGNLNSGLIWEVVSLNGKVYFESESTITIYDKSNDSISKVVYESGFYDIEAWKDKVWTITRDGLIGFLVDGVINNVARMQGIGDTEVRELYVHQDALHILLYDGRLYRFDGMFVSQLALPPSLQGVACFSAGSFDANLHCIGTISDGFIQLDGRKNQVVTQVNSENGLIDNTVLALARDDNGNVWLGLDYGIAYVELQNAIKPIFNSGATYFIEDHNEQTFLATNKGLYAASGMNPFELIPESGGQVWRLRYHNEELFVCHNIGLLQMEGNKIQSLYSNDGVMDVAWFGQTGYLLISAYTGLLLGKFSGDKLTILENLNYWGNPKVVYDAENDCIWADTRWGTLSQFIHRGNKVERKDFETIQSFFHSHGRFVFYDGQQLLDYSNEEFVAKNVAPYHVISGDSITALVMDEDDQQVAYIQRGIPDLVVGLPDGNHYSYRKILSSVKNNLIEHDVFMDLHNNELRIATERGVVTFNTEAKSEQTKSTKPVISKVFVQDDDAPSKEFTFPFVIDELFLSAGEKDLVFHFGFIKSSSDLVEFRYRLWPYNREWSDWNATISSKEYTKISGGNYKFALQSRLNGGVVKEHSLTLRIDKYWYQTKWVLVPYLLVFLICILGTVYFMNSRSKRKIRLEKEKHKRSIVKKTIDIKNEQLLQYTEVISRKNAFLNEVKDGLARMRSSEAKQWERKIEDEVNSEKKNFFFHKLFSELHQDFITRLSEQYPNLTAHDVRLISFIRINLGTREIANLMNVTTKSVDVSRYRIRKKMNLSHETDLNVFIREL